MATKDNNGKSPVIGVAKERSERDYDEIVVLSTGIRVKLHGVSATLIDEVSSRIADPEIPVIFDEDKQRNIENPFDPKYIKAVDQVAKLRGVAALDAMIMFGVILVDPIPPDSEWLPKLLYLQKRGNLDLSPYDLKDPFEKEFVFKRYVAVGSDDLQKIGGQVTQAQVAQAEAAFQGDKG